MSTAPNSSGNQSEHSSLLSPGHQFSISIENNHDGQQVTSLSSYVSFSCLRHMGMSVGGGVIGVCLIGGAAGGLIGTGLGMLLSSGVSYCYRVSK